jgi:hypothetical protein
VVMLLNVFNYAIILYFIYKFYTNYRKISFTDSSRVMMRTILKVKRTVTQYVWFNLIIFTVSAIIYGYGVLLYTPEGQEIVQAAAQDGDSTEFWALIIITSIALTAVGLFIIWLFYKLLYGILLKKLRKNYNELKRLEV